MTSSPRQTNAVLIIAEFLPLTAFLVCRRVIDTADPMQWQVPFHCGGILGLAVICACLYKRFTMNRIFLGINLYLVSGSLAFVTNQFWLNSLYDRLLASGMLMWVVVTGLLALLFSPAGFVGHKGSDKTPKKSIYLLLAALAAFGLSFATRGNPLFSQIIPFAGLFAVQAALTPKPDSARQPSQDRDSTASRR